MTGIGSVRVAVPDGSLHCLSGGEGTAIVFLHGWPEWSGAWRLNLPALAREFRVVAPDLRGFGDSLKPADPAGAADHVADLVAILDALGLDRVGIVAHDVGAQVAQAFALAHPGRVSRLFFFDCPYPGIGRRWAEAPMVNEIWYQSFQQLPWAAGLVGSSREACRLYIGHFLSHWAADPSAFDAVLEDWVDNFMKPGNLADGFGWYRAVNELRLAQIEGGPQPRPRIAAPATCLWGACDPVIPPRFAEGIEAYFADISVETVPDAGHFVFFEKPALANARIRAFFGA